MRYDFITKQAFSNAVFHDKAGQEKQYTRDARRGLESCLVRYSPVSICMGSTKNSN